MFFHSLTATVYTFTDTYFSTDSKDCPAIVGNPDVVIFESIDPFGICVRHGQAVAKSTWITSETLDFWNTGDSFHSVNCTIGKFCEKAFAPHSRAIGLLIWQYNENKCILLE